MMKANSIFKLSSSLLQPRFIKWVLIVMFIFTAKAFAITSPLPADRAFIFSAKFIHQNELLVEWQIAPSYYLYSKKMRFTFTEVSMEQKSKDIPTQTAKIISDVQLPQGNYQYDKDRNRYEAFSGILSVPILLKTPLQQIQMTVDYQGCSQDGFCYPPMQQSRVINLTTQTITKIDETQPSFSSLLTNQNKINALLQNQNMGVILFIFVGLGVLLALTPCVWPMVPILATIIVGQKNQNTKRAFFLSITYVFGAALVYALVGLLAASLGNSVQVWLQQPWIITMTSILFVFLALSLFGLYDLQLPRHWQHRIGNWNRAQHGGSYSGAFLMGVISTLIVSPCVTAPLVGVLMYIAHTGDRLLGASALFAMGMGMGLPLIAIGASVGKWLPRSGPWMEAIKKFFGVLLLGMAIWLFSRMTSTTLTVLLYLLLVIGVILLIYYEVHSKFLSKKMLSWQRQLLVTGTVMLIISMLVMFGIKNRGLPAYVNQQSSFVTVRNATEFNRQLELAQSMRKPVILDFYADWCESCVMMDKRVFRREEVKQALSNYILLRADLSNNTREDEALLKTFNVIAPPTVLFFNPNGQELASQRIVGEVSAKEFLQRVIQIEDSNDSNTCHAPTSYQQC